MILIPNHPSTKFPKKCLAFLHFVQTPKRCPTFWVSLANTQCNPVHRYSLSIVIERVRSSSLALVLGALSHEKVSASWQKARKKKELPSQFTKWPKIQKKKGGRKKHVYIYIHVYTYVGVQKRLGSCGFVFPFPQKIEKKTQRDGSPYWLVNRTFGEFHGMDASIRFTPQKNSHVTWKWINPWKFGDEPNLETINRTWKPIIFRFHLCHVRSSFVTKSIISRSSSALRKMLQQQKMVGLIFIIGYSPEN